MAITGTFEADGRRWVFRRPHVGPVMRFNETIELAGEGKASWVDVLRASVTVIHDAVARVDPAVTRQELEDGLDQVQLREFQKAVMALIGVEEPAPGEPSSP